MERLSEADFFSSLQPVLVGEDEPQRGPMTDEEWQAHLQQERRSRLVKLTADSVPRSYRWARRSAPELAKRVGRLRLEDGSDTTVARVLDEARTLSGAVLTGPAGSGKTSLACAMLEEWVTANERAAVFEHGFRIGAARIQNKAGTGEAPIIDRAMRAWLLLIDDVGSERDTANNAMLDVVFERHAEEMPLWVTTGLTSSQLATRYGAGFLRRITERATLIRVGGE